MKYVPKEITQEVNVTRRHPLANFAYLLGTVVLLSLLIFVALGYTASYLTTKISPETEAKIGQMLATAILEDELKDEQRIQYIKELLGLDEEGVECHVYGSRKSGFFLDKISNNIRKAAATDMDITCYFKNHHHEGSSSSKSNTSGDNYLTPQTQYPQKETSTTSPRDTRGKSMTPYQSFAVEKLRQLKEKLVAN